ncbi:hypothetical protein [Streptomyces capoamus]|uniref:Uncharacterized protein n=1 Tax=Streptomyces capoamus TaxID=68183 RepID=A0A919KEJ7_9ACTN|nr:hypothetical protein [Streptomyces capoamus]GGW20902.1 hypothetical protein GCM10010501_70580 [Streptomyces libani subsp. rufus]GHG64581.1 hypothetical protein GCM10018980_55950 [Streptomyces capoamus]
MSKDLYAVLRALLRAEARRAPATRPDRRAPQPQRSPEERDR